MSLTATKSITIAAPAQRVWDALTDPAQVKQYMWGAELVTDWQQGSAIVYRGEWEGRPYEDKGTVVEIDPPRLLRTTYYSPLSGKADAPENYAEVVYALEPSGAGTTLTVTQSNIADEAGKERSEGNWGGVLETMKTMIEG